MLMSAPRGTRSTRRPAWGRLAIMFGLTFTATASAELPAVHFYSTAAPPANHPGPAPAPAASPATTATASPGAESEPTEDKPLTLAQVASQDLPERLAANTTDTAPPKGALPSPAPSVAPTLAPDPIAEAKAAIASCRVSYSKVQDYTCTFFKREQIKGRLSSHNVMQMKAITRPMAVYFKFIKPTAGREAIYVAGAHGGKALVHDVGIGKLLAGTLKLDPKSDMAMEGCRHPITDAGIGNMIETIATAWDKELHADESIVTMHGNLKVGDRPCFVIESIHPVKMQGFLYHKVKVYIDTELNLPIRFEAYDWPRAGRPAELVEEYTYSNLRLNVGLTGRDFDPANSSYSFGRF